MANHEHLLLTLTNEEVARFSAKIWNRGPSNCWPWFGASTWGYGAVKIRSKPFRAHRVVWILGHGKPIKKGYEVAHSCHYRRCCNPAHLSLKTASQNAFQKSRAGRHHKQGFVYKEPPVPKPPRSYRVKKLRELLEARFWDAFEKSKGEPGECWEWQGAINHAGYGRLELKSKALGLREGYMAHQLAYQHHVGEIPTGLCIRHTCDNPPCVNPSHLLVGTHQENMNDMVEAGRNFKPTGEKSGRARLTESDVLRIRSMIEEGNSSLAEIARQYGVHSQTIWCIKHRKSWTHI